MQLKLEQAFKNRLKPEFVTNSQEVYYEKKELSEFAKKKWDELSLTFLQNNGSAYYQFDPNFFFYYLPGIILTSYKENSIDSFIFDSVFFELDVPLNNAEWSKTFKNRWPELSQEELNCVLLWIEFVEELVSCHVIKPFNISAAKETIVFLLDEKKAGKT